MRKSARNSVFLGVFRVFFDAKKEQERQWLEIGGQGLGRDWGVGVRAAALLSNTLSRCHPDAQRKDPRLLLVTSALAVIRPEPKTRLLAGLN